MLRIWLKWRPGLVTGSATLELLKMRCDSSLGSINQLFRVGIKIRFGSRFVALILTGG